MLLDVDPHGRVAAQDDETRRALADRAGRFVLLPAAPDLLVARRTPPAGGSAPPPRCAVTGDLSAVPFPELVAFIHQSRLSGTLTVSAGGVERSLAFSEGEVRSAHSEAAGERLGEVALRLGFVDEMRLGEALREGGPIGKALVDRGFLAAADLFRCLHEQVVAVFHAMLLSREGVFVLLDGPAAEDAPPLSVSTQSLLMDGVRRIDEMSLFRAKIPDAGTRLRRAEPRRPVSLQPLERSILALVDGCRDVAAVARAAHLSEIDALKILYHLAEAGYVEAARTSEAPADGASRVRAIADEMNAALRETAAAAGPGLERLLPRFRAYLADGGAPRAALFEGVGVGADGALDADALLARVAALDAAALRRLGSSDPARVLFDALEDLVLFHVFEAGERLPREADDTLGRTVKARLAPLRALCGREV